MSKDLLYNYQNKKQLVFNDHGVSSSSSSSESEDENETDDDSMKVTDDDEKNDTTDSIQPPSTKRQKLLLDLDDSIDLMSPKPTLPKPKTANMAKELLSRLSKNQNNISSPASSNNSFVIEDDPEVTIKVRIHGTIKKYTLKSSCHFSDLVEQIANDEKKEKQKIKLYRKEIPVELHETLQNITVATIIECIIHETVEIEDDEGITIKIQTADTAQNIRAARCEYKINENEKLKRILEEYAKENNTTIEKIDFLFDGESINENSIPLDIGIENEDIIDAIFK